MILLNIDGIGETQINSSKKFLLIIKINVDVLDQELQAILEVFTMQ